MVQKSLKSGASWSENPIEVELFARFLCSKRRVHS